MNDEQGTTGTPGSGQLRDEAALWYARMRSERAEQFRPEFEAWLARGALHRAAYNRIGDVFVGGKVLKESGWSPSVAARGPSRSQTRLVKGAAAFAVVLAVAIGSLPMWRNRGASPSFVATANAQAVTRIGEIRRLELPGGVAVVLDTNTLLVSNVDGDSHLARLERGRARFAAGRAGTAIAVRVGDFEARTNDATFDLSIADDGTIETSVINGAVALRAPRSTRNSPAAYTLRAGGHVATDQRGRRVPPRIRSNAAWAQGILEFRAAPLDDVLAEANRYALVRIVVTDRALGRRRISGRFRVDDTQVLARRLATTLGIAAVPDGRDRIVLEATH